MRLAVTTLAGDTREVRATAADRVAWEGWARRNSLPLQPAVHGAGTADATVDVSGFPLDTYHCYLAYRADTRHADPRPGFAQWLDDLEQVTPVAEDRPADPTRPGPGPA